MKVLVDINKITKHNIQYNEPTTHAILHDNTFVRTGYSNICFTTNDIYVGLGFYIEKIDKYFNKYKFFLDSSKNTRQIDKLITLEKIILDGIDLPGIHKIYKIKELISNEVISLFDTDSNLSTTNSSRLYNFKLKISGIWISNATMAIAYKFVLD